MVEDWKRFSAAEHQKCGFGQKTSTGLISAWKISAIFLSSANLSKPDKDSVAWLVLPKATPEQAAVPVLVFPWGALSDFSEFYEAQN